MYGRRGATAGRNGALSSSALRSMAEVHIALESRLTLVAASAAGYGTITVVCDSMGTLGQYTYSGQFQ